MFIRTVVQISALAPIFLKKSSKDDYRIYFEMFITQQNSLDILSSLLKYLRQSSIKITFSRSIQSYTG